MTPISRIHRLKTIILALIALGLGVALLTLANFADNAPALQWMLYWPIAELGSILAGAGLLGIGYNYLVDRDKDAVDEERTKRLLKEAAPDFRDAVVQGFAVSPDDLKRVATPELLDSIATNAMGLRLGDAAFAAEVYEGVRDQAIRAPERWYDAQVQIRLSCIQERSTEGTPLVPLFEVSVRWEYTVTPSHPVRRFACTSDRDEFYDLITDVPSTSAWFLSPASGMKANDRAAFELLQFTVDGKEQRIRRSERKTGQTYSANLGDDVMREGKPVRISHTYRTVTAKSVHRLRFTVAQPTRGLDLSFDYTDTDIAEVLVSDLHASAQRTRIIRTPEEVAARAVAVEVPGWQLPQTEITYVWTLAGELPQTATAHADSVA